MLFTQFNLEDAKKIWYEEAFKDGEERGLENGRTQGENINMIRLVQRKLRKGKTAAVMLCGLDAEPQVIYEQMQNEILES